MTDPRRVRSIARMAFAVTVQREAGLLVVAGQGRASLADLKGFADLTATRRAFKAGAASLSF